MHMASLLDRPPKLAGKHVLSVEDKPLVPLQAENELRGAERHRRDDGIIVLRWPALLTAARRT